ncbi:hypothetical protein BHM03_00042391 [Ensete ventricosum]|nr:hypothetical protein BHM03_00042391 [Ensete ventricosum]
MVDLPQEQRKPRAHILSGTNAVPASPADYSSTSAANFSSSRSVYVGFSPGQSCRLQLGQSMPTSVLASPCRLHLGQSCQLQLGQSMLTLASVSPTNFSSANSCRL